MTDYDAFSDHQIKHLDMLQSVIARLGNDSFLVKGWGITVVGALLAFAVNSHDVDLALIALLPALLFWALDAYFLRAERLFRHLFEYVRRGDKAIEPFFMAATTSEFVGRLGGTERHETLLRTVRRSTLLIFYGTLTATAAAVAIAIGAS